MTQQSVNISNFESQSKSKKKSCGNKKIYIIGGVLILVCVLIGLLVAFLPVEDSIEDTPEVEALPTGIRLPGTLVPIHYDIYIKAFINGNFSTKGHVDINFEVRNATSYVILHMLDIITDNSSIKLINEEDKEVLEFEGHAYDPKKQFYIGTLTAPLKAGNNYTISLDYIGYLNTELDGFYRSVYQNENNKEINLASTQFEATYARKAFPCFDEPELKATFKISLARETKMNSISNMPIESTKDHGEEWKLDTFKVTPNMSTYLVAFTISDFECKQAPSPTIVPIAAYARKEVVDKTEYALSITNSILKNYQEYFEIKYALEKLDMLGIPDFRAGAMENWGLVIYREEDFLHDETLSSELNKQRVGSVIAHELGHQWFGDLVTPTWWSDIWLNEGFATYASYENLNQVEKDFKMNDQFVVNELQAALSEDCFITSHPISVQVQDPDEIYEIFDGISYSKGASIIRMMESFLPDDSFKTGLQNYLNDLQYSSAVQDDLWNYMTKAAQDTENWEEDLSVKQIMDTWTLQMGYPVITVNKTETGITVTQERFLLNKSHASPGDEYSWWIPLSYVFDTSELPETEWMKPTDKTKELPGFPDGSNWVIFNFKETSYYRVNYDKENWEALSKQLKESPAEIELLNRVQIIDDTLNLARGGFLSYETALDLNKFLEDEPEYVPWSSAMKNLYYLESMFSRTGGYGYMKNFLTQLASKLYDSVTFEEGENDNHMTILKRSAVLSWMCNLNYPYCIENSVTQYKNFMTNSDDIPANVRPTVLCYGIAEGDEIEWDAAWKAYLESKFAPEKDDLMSAMGCSKYPWLLARYLDRTFKEEDSKIRRQDAARVFNAVASNLDVGREVAWSYLKTNWDVMAAYYGSAVNLGGFIASVTRSFNTEDDLKQLLYLKDERYAEFGNATKDFDQSIENVQYNIDWMNLYYDTINTWLIKESDPPANDQAESN